MIDRRRALFGGLALTTFSGTPVAALAALPVPLSNRLAFDVVRKGTKLGTHVITFAQAGDRLIVKVDVRLAYKVLGVTLFQYAHACTETWQGGEVIGFESHTNANGKPHRVSATRGAGGLAVQGTAGPRYIAPANALPATHWNPRELEGPWINTQDGKLYRPRAAPRGTETIPAAGGHSLSARRYDLTGDVTMSMWYDRVGWAGLAFTMAGSQIRYERQG